MQLAAADAGFAARAYPDLWNQSARAELMRQYDLKLRTAEATAMEHRHGHRRAVDVRVTIRTHFGAGGAGWIDEASMSGARLVTTLPLRIHSIIVLSLAVTAAGHRHLKLEAEVIRRTRNGFGVEWTQFAPESLPALYSHTAAKAMHGGGRQT